jgi:hypothetical protein
VDNSSLWVGGADEDDCRSSGDEWWNDLLAVPLPLPLLPNNRFADSSMMQSIGAVRNSAANTRSDTYNNCLRSFCIRSCSRLVGVGLDLRVGPGCVWGGDEINWRPNKGVFSVFNGDMHMLEMMLHWFDHSLNWMMLMGVAVVWTLLCYWRSDKTLDMELGCMPEHFQSQLELALG